MSNEIDPRIVHEMKLRLSKHLDCSYEQVTEVKQSFIDAIVEEHALREDVAEYRFVMFIALDHGDHKLAELMHLYSVGYFVEDTESYQIKLGDDYEITNSNFLNAWNINSNGTRAA